MTQWNLTHHGLRGDQLFQETHFDQQVLPVLYPQCHLADQTDPVDLMVLEALWALLDPFLQQHLLVPLALLAQQDPWFRYRLLSQRLLFHRSVQGSRYFPRGRYFPLHPLSQWVLSARWGRDPLVDQSLPGFLSLLFHQPPLIFLVDPSHLLFHSGLDHQSLPRVPMVRANPDPEPQEVQRVPGFLQDPEVRQGRVDLCFHPFP